MNLMYVLLALCIVIIILLAVLLIRVESYTKSAGRDEDRMYEMMLRSQSELGENLRKGQSELNDNLRRGQSELGVELRKGQNELNDSILKGFGVMQNSVETGLKTMSETTGRRLNDIQADISTRLDRSLDERLDSSFRQVGERLESLYTSLGELKNLESGVASLNRTLSNVKTRGIFGEMQLGNILASVLDKSQYDMNVAMRPATDERVEYAVRIPDKEGAGFIWLPIDSKYPADIYGRIMNAADEGQPEELKRASAELAARIRQEAASIRDKYVNPPQTTDFAVMFLPTEGLYSEVLRIDGLVEDCQNRYKVVISGPATLTALLNSLSVGFRYLTVNKKSEEILRTLGAFKTQFGKFDDLISQMQKKLSEAQSKTDQLSDRSRLIRKQLGKVESIEYDESMRMLSDGNYLPEDYDMN